MRWQKKTTQWSSSLGMESRRTDTWRGDTFDEKRKFQSPLCRRIFPLFAGHLLFLFRLCGWRKGKLCCFDNKLFAFSCGTWNAQNTRERWPWKGTLLGTTADDAAFNLLVGRSCHRQRRKQMINEFSFLVFCLSKAFWTLNLNVASKFSFLDFISLHVLFRASEDDEEKYKQQKLIKCKKGFRSSLTTPIVIGSDNWLGPDMPWEFSARTAK